MFVRNCWYVAGWTSELLQEHMPADAYGRALLAGMSLFWVGRTIEQFVFLRINRPLVHALTALFVLGAVLFAMPLLG